MHVFSDLGAGADSGPGVDHGAFIDIGTDVDKTWHQNRAFGDEATTARHSGWHHAHAGGLKFGFRQMGKFSRYFVVKSQIAGLHHDVVFEAEAQQHGFFDPLVHRPLAHALLGGDTQLAVVQVGDDVLDSVGDFFGCGGDGDVGAVVPGGVDDVLELLCHGEKLKTKIKKLK